MFGYWYTYIHVAICAYAITVLHKRLMCLGMQRRTHTTFNPVTPYPFIFISYKLAIRNCTITYTNIHCKGRIYGSNCYQVTECDTGVSLHSKTHPLFMYYSNGIYQYTLCYVYAYPNLFAVPFLHIPICPF